MNKQNKLEKRVEDFFEFNIWLSNNIHTLLGIKFEDLDYKTQYIHEDSIEIIIYERQKNGEKLPIGINISKDIIYEKLKLDLMKKSITDF